MKTYVKLIEGRLDFPPKNKDGIINYNLDEERLIADGYKELIRVKQEDYPVGNRIFHFEYEETEDTITEIIVFNETQEEADEREARQERERLDALTLTPADVERALYRAKQMDFEDLKTLIAQELPQVDIKGLAIEFRAKDFYRGAEAAGMRLFDVVGALLGYTTDDMDYLFMNKELPTEE